MTEDSFKPAYFGYSKSLLESLRYLSLAYNYAIGISEYKAVAQRRQDLVAKIDKLFDQHQFIYLFFIEQDKDTTGINKSGHAEAIILETLLSDRLQPSSLSLDFFLNIKKETSKIKQELLDANHELNIDRVVHDFDHYINKIQIS